MAKQDRLRPHPESRFAPEERRLDLGALTEELRREPTSHGGHRQRTFFKHATMTMALFLLDAGASLPRHTARGTVVIQVLDGEVEIQTPQERHALAGGQLLMLAAGVPHDVRAVSAARMLLTVQLEAAAAPAT